MGDRDGARETVDALLAAWKRADPDLPYLAEARALRARIAGSGGGAAQNRPSSR